MDPMLADALKRIDGKGGWIEAERTRRTRDAAASRRTARRNARRAAIRVAVG